MASQASRPGWSSAAECGHGAAARLAGTPGQGGGVLVIRVSLPASSLISGRASGSAALRPAAPAAAAILQAPRLRSWAAALRRENTPQTGIAFFPRTDGSMGPAYE